MRLSKMRLCVLNYRYLLVLFLFKSIVSLGQDIPPGFQRVIPPSPTNAAFAKFSEIPVSLYTGIPSISVPLWEVKSRKLNVPISLSYSSSGIKVEEAGGWTGIGWNLNAGGRITRSVRGKADDSENGYYTNPWDSLPILENDINSFGPWAPHYFWGSLEVPADHYLRQIAQGVFDTEPDIFYFNLNGVSGKFIFDLEGNPVILPHQNIKIEVDSFDGYEILSWLITTEDGTKYYLGGSGCVEETFSVSSMGVTADDQTTYYSAWLLKEISTPDNLDSIVFEYDEYAIADIISPVSQTSGCDDPPVESTTLTMVTRVTQRYLTSITSPREEVSFYSSDKDIGGLNSRYFYTLDSIGLKSSTGSRLKSFELTYEYLTVKGCNENNNYLEPCKKLKLISVAEHPQYGMDLKPPWKFIYNSDSIPSRSSFSQDHWGFYNGADNNHLLPSVIVHNHENYEGPEKSPYPGDFDEYHWSNFADINIQMENVAEESWQIDGAFREPDEEATKAGILEEIHYPTGGYTKFEYELNDFGFISTNRPFLKKEIYVDSMMMPTETTGYEVPFYVDHPQLVEIYSLFGTIDEEFELGEFKTHIYILDPSSDTIFSRYHDGANDQYYERVWIDQENEPFKLGVRIDILNMTDVMWAHLYYTTIDNFNTTYPTYTSKNEPEYKTVGAVHFPDNESYYCSDTFTVTENDNGFLDIDYSFNSILHPNVISGGGLTMVKIVEASDTTQVVYSAGYYPSDTTIYWDGSRYNLNGEDRIHLGLGLYKMIFIPRVDTESGQINYIRDKWIGDIRKTPTGGVRVKKISTFDGISHENDIVKEFEYEIKLSTADTSDRSSGVLINYPKFYSIPFSEYYTTMGQDIPFVNTPFKRFSVSQINYGETQGSHVGYRRVTEKTSDNGYVVSEFTSPVEYPNMVDLGYPYVPELSFSWKHGLLKSKEVYSELGLLLSKEVNCYNSVDDTTNRKFLGFLRAVQVSDHNSSAYYNKFQVIRGWNHLDYTVRFSYDENGENPIIDTTYYYYDNPKHLQVTRKSNIKSNGDQIITKIYYPQDFNETIPDKFNAMGKAIKAMADTLHMHNNILESLVFQKKQGEEEELISGTATSYKRQRENQVLPSQILQIEMDEPITDFKVWASDTSYTYDERYSKIGEYQKYDIYGNILQTKDVSEVITSYKWGYNNTLPVAKVINAEYDDIGGTFPNYYWPDTARGSKYQYLIPWGISIVKDVNNLTTIYSYDHYGRLSAIYDHEGNTINQYTYNYYISDSISNPPTSISASKESIINCETISLSVVGGTLGEGASWEWYTGSEGGTYAGSGSAINVTPSQNTIYYVRAEGYNKTSSVSKSITVSQPSLSVYPTTLNYSYTGNVGDPDSVIISYQGCYSTSVSESLDWITPQTYSGGFSITCSSNSNPTTRNGNITVSDGNISGVIQVSQDAYVVQADFTYSTPKDPTLVKFIDTSTGDPTSWAWDFDNNGTTDSTLQNPQHTFSGGNHYVKLTASKSGSSDFIVKLVVVID